MATLLLVDDDPQIVRAIIPALEVNGLRVTVANTGGEAIRQLDDSEWDALVVDLGLPDMDGKTIIRHSRGRSVAPVIVISAQHLSTEVEAAHAAGAGWFLHKPFRTPDLIRCIHHALGA